MNSIKHGLIHGKHVHDVLERVLPLSETQWFVIVRSIDSSHTKDRLQTALAFSDVPFEVINGNICVRIEVLQKALDRGMFTGFDEVWIIDGKPPSMDLESEAETVSDTVSAPGFRGNAEAETVSDTVSAPTPFLPPCEYAAPILVAPGPLNPEREPNVPPNPRRRKPNKRQTRYGCVGNALEEE